MLAETINKTEILNINRYSPNEIISQLLRLIGDRNSVIDLETLERAFYEVLTNQDVKARDVQLGSILTGMLARGPSSEEIYAMLNIVCSLDSYPFNNNQKIVVQSPNGKKIVGLAGSGKKGIKTVNISTPSGLIAASLGATLAKSTSSSTSSLSGSSDFLSYLGVNVILTREEAIKIMLETGFGVFSIENQIPKFDSVYGGKVYAPTALSFALAALLLPIRVDNIIYGLAHNEIGLSAEVLQKFNFNNATVVTSRVGTATHIDELSIMGENYLVEMINGQKQELQMLNLQKSLNLPPYSINTIVQGTDLRDNVMKSVNVLRGEGEKPLEDMICLNAGLILVVSEIAENLREGYMLAKKAITQDLIIEKLHELVVATSGDINKFNAILT